MIGVSGLDRYHERMRVAKARVQNKVTAYYRGMVTEMLIDLAKATPQWSGDLAASWQVVVGKSNSAIPNHTTSLKVSPWQRLIGHPHKMGDDGAVEHSFYNNLGAIDSIRWNSKVSIVNTNPTADILDSIKLRPENLLPDGRSAVAHVIFKYKFNFVKPKSVGP